MRYNSLITAIPVSWRQALKTQKDSVEQSINYLSADLAYAQLLQKKNLVSLIKHQEGWQNELEMEIPYEEYVHTFLDIYRTSNVAKLRSFQYRLLHRALITNVQLYK